MKSKHSGRGHPRPYSQWEVTAVFAALMLTCLPAQASDDIVAIVDLRFIEDTGEPSSYFCLDDEDCWVTSTYFLFDARVRNVISGELPDRRFRVIYGSHYLREGNMRRAIVMLRPLEGEHADDRAYQIELVGGFGKEHTMYCFPRADENESAEPDYIVESADGRALNCYEPGID